MKLILVRHGETEENAKKIIQGQTDNSLNENGRAQAKEVGRQLKGKYKIDIVFCSPLKRCQETLEEILSECSIDGEICMSCLIKERDFGEYTGVETNLIDWEEIYEDNKVNEEMGVESQSKLEKRVELFLEDLKLEEGDKTVLIVSHGGPIMAMINKLTGQSMKYPETKIKNAEVMEFDYDTSLEF
jgi:2,3-bisphosphoglycerate-dependent phosphoglycerate mutase